MQQQVITEGQIQPNQGLQQLVQQSASQPQQQTYEILQRPGQTENGYSGNVVESQCQNNCITSKFFKSYNNF